ncbi:MAG: hypothetical protein NOU37_09250 [Candidatus Brocadiales bacterium]|nr:hypothetical protein [Candidatus Bathyanammoxibius amoris]
MALMSATEVRQHIDTDLVDAALQRLIDAAEEDIDTHFGSVTSQLDELLGNGGKHLWPTRPIKTVSSIVETVGTTDTTLASDDYKLLHGGRQIERLNTGTNARNSWGDRTKIQYTPEDETKKRKGILIKLVKLEVEYNGLSSERAGDYQSSSLDYEGERKKILGGLAGFGSFV